jgi:hypothetical protein
MARSPYPGFTPLNNRRLELVKKKHYGGGLTLQEGREMEMLSEVVDAMVHYHCPTIDLDKKFMERFGITIEGFTKKMGLK